MTFLDICAGIGGFRAGLERAGHKCVGYIEIDKFARKSYEMIHETKGEYTAFDLKEVKAEDIPQADMWCFGFPCQDISVSGSKKGIDGGKRSSIFYTIVELIKGKSPEDRPEWLLIENVKNLLSINGGRDFTKVLSEISTAGYDAEWHLVNSKDHGVPQNRERVFIIGHLRERGGQEVLPITGADKQTGIDISNLTPKQIIGGSQAYRIYDSEGLAVTQKAEGGGVGAKTGLYTIQKEGDQTRDSYGILLYNNQEYYIRRLTPRECFRLQGFSDEQFNKLRIFNSNTQLYKQAGNAVTTNVAEMIGRYLISCV